MISTPLLAQANAGQATDEEAEGKEQGGAVENPPLSLAGVLVATLTPPKSGSEEATSSE